MISPVGTFNNIFKKKYWQLPKAVVLANWQIVMTRIMSVLLVSSD